MNRIALVILCLLYRDWLLGSAYLDAVSRGDAEGAMRVEREMVRPI